ncbi:MerR family transcriptional regulator [Leisingera sp. SS27]|uniref:MerR family transcriptional regulator n=1 Tax=Leisingera sp. SS27 TaxID=2979462 RepID=UPI00232C1C85|nr:MerR family transcriptional regulator [Leisingera sp. SS27]MDC0656961.1 MerR family transcriptional regulator [Leisingera sp. SS27]
MSKSPDAFRTISEVAEWLDVQAHVLRFWESKFTQVKPVKRAGGRRYYRPADMQLLGGIRKLLHVDGLSIKEVQALLREQGVAHVASLSHPLDGEEEPAVEAAAPADKLGDDWQQSLEMSAEASAGGSTEDSNVVGFPQAGADDGPPAPPAASPAAPRPEAAAAPQMQMDLAPPAASESPAPSEDAPAAAATAYTAPSADPASAAGEPAGLAKDQAEDAAPSEDQAVEDQPVSAQQAFGSEPALRPEAEDTEPSAADSTMLDQEPEPIEASPLQDGADTQEQVAGPAPGQPQQLFADGAGTEPETAASLMEDVLEPAFAPEAADRTEEPQAEFSGMPGAAEDVSAPVPETAEPVEDTLETVPEPAAEPAASAPPSPLADIAPLTGQEHLPEPDSGAGTAAAEEPDLAAAGLPLEEENLETAPETAAEAAPVTPPAPLEEVAPLTGQEHLSAPDAAAAAGTEAPEKDLTGAEAPADAGPILSADAQAPEPEPAAAPAEFGADHSAAVAEPAAEDVPPAADADLAEPGREVLPDQEPEQDTLVPAAGMQPEEPMDFAFAAEDPVQTAPEPEEDILSDSAAAFPPHDLDEAARQVDALEFSSGFNGGGESGIEETDQPEAEPEAEPTAEPDALREPDTLPEPDVQSEPAPEEISAEAAEPAPVPAVEDAPEEPAEIPGEEPTAAPAPLQPGVLALLAEARSLPPQSLAAIAACTEELRALIQNRP